MAASIGRTVLVTGAGRYLGARIAARLLDDPGVARVLGVDTVPPGPGTPASRAEFVRADIRHPMIGKIIDQARVHTVVHVAYAQDEVTPGEHAAGGLSLLRAARRARALTRFVSVSSTAVYGAGSSDPAVFGEQDSPVDELPAGLPREAADLEARLRAFARERDDVTVTVPRLASVVGPGVESWLTRYLALPVAPTYLGFDPRLQLLHEYDAVESVVHLACGAGSHVDGAVNVAGAGVLTLSQALRVCGRPSVPLASPALRAVQVGHRELRRLLRFGRVVDTGRLVTQAGYRPRYTTAEALYAYVDARPGLPGLTALAVAAVAGAQRALGVPA